MKNLFLMVKTTMASFIAASVMMMSVSASFAFMGIYDYTSYDSENLSERVDVMISLREGIDTAAVRSYISHLDSEAVFMKDFKYLMNGFACTASLEAIYKIKSLDYVEAVYYSGICELYENETENQSDILSSIADIKVHDSDYRGEGMVAAIIDNGFDVNHEVFVLSNEENAAIKKEDIDSMLDKGELSISNYSQYQGNKSPYVNSKIPYAFDYGDYDFDVSVNDFHGTHVAGIIGANNKNENEFGFNGIAPECQFLFMKIGSGENGGLTVHLLAYAVEDAITLGADVINMSFGSIGGPNDYNLDDYSIGGMIEKAVNNGVVVVCAAGNHSEIGEGGNYSSLYGIDQVSVLNPDYGTIASPATYSSSFSVASVNNESQVVSDYIKTAEGDIILYHTSDLPIYPEILGEESIEYVAVGIGDKSDYNEIDVSGKIALIARGTITFASKVVNAQNAGAIGAILYNNTADEEFLIGLDDSCVIPAVSVSYEDGMRLKDADTKTIEFISGKNILVDMQNGGEISSFSSRGISNDLSLKPEITGVGGGVYSSVPGGYDALSGTSMAAPYISGSVLILKEKLLEEEFEDSVEFDIRRIMMSTADTLTDAQSGVEYSPRIQGAGSANLDRALNFKSVLYSDSGLTKIELGDNLGKKFDITFTVKNYSDEPITYNISASVMSDEYEYIHYGNDGGYFSTGKSSPFKRALMTLEGGEGFNINKYKGRKSESITIGAGETVEITIHIEMDRTEYSKYQSIFKNGFFVEGYVWLTPVDDEEGVLSIPYIGYVGEWDLIPVFEGTVNEKSDDSLYTQYAFSTLRESGRIYKYYLGRNIFNLSEETNQNLILISPNGDRRADSIALELSPQRSVSEMIIEVFSDDGEKVSEIDIPIYVKKTFYVDDESDLYVYDMGIVWNGSDISNSEYHMKDGKYTLVIKSKIENGEHYQEWSFDFAVDTVYPTLNDIYLKKTDGKTYLCVEASDNYALQCVNAYLGNENYGEPYCPPAPYAKSSLTVEIDITDAADKDYIYLELIDFAMNMVTERVIVSSLEVR